MPCIVIVAKCVDLIAIQRFIVSKALSERYVYTSDHDTNFSQQLEFCTNFTIAGREGALRHPAKVLTLRKNTLQKNTKTYEPRIFVQQLYQLYTDRNLVVKSTIFDGKPEPLGGSTK